jgi:hypothetical protein
VSRVALPQLSPRSQLRAMKNRMFAFTIEIRPNLINKLELSMNLRETLILKTLQFKSVYTGAGNDALVDMVIDQNPDEASKIMRNVCAMVPIGLSDRMQEMGGLLGMNKREIITAGVIEFLRQAQETLDEFDAFSEEPGGGMTLDVVEQAK